MDWEQVLKERRTHLRDMWKRQNSTNKGESVVARGLPVG